MQFDENLKKVVVLGTGGTIAGTAQSGFDNIGYTAAQLGIGALLEDAAGLPDALSGDRLDSEQVAQIDSKDMCFEIWLALAQCVRRHLAQPDVRGVVITHGTDTLEETAYFLQAVLPAALINAKPVVLTCAMRPASAQNPDGPQNLLDAVAVVRSPGAQGVVAVCAGAVHTALDVQKNHTYQLDAFSSGDAGALAYVEEGQLRMLRNWPLAIDDKASSAIEIIANTVPWPRVEVVMSYAGCSGAVVDAMRQPLTNTWPVRGFVVAGTGNGTIHHDLEQALRRAAQCGIKVVRATRCANGRVLAAPGREFNHSNGLSPVKARIALMLQLMLQPEAG